MTSITAPLVLIARRIGANWRFQLVLFAGILMATTVLSGAPMYLKAIEELGLRHSLRFERTGVLDTAVIVPFRPLDESGYATANERVTGQAAEHIGSLVDLQVAHIKTPGLNLAHAARPRGGDQRAAIQSYSDYEDHARVVEGRFPRSLGATPGYSVTIEAALGARAASRFQVGLDDEITLTPVGSDPSRVITAKIVGILEANDIRETYWSFAIDPFSPQVDASTGVEIPMLPVLVPPETFLVDISSAFRGILVDYWWFFFIDPTLIEAKDVSRTKSAMSSMQEQLSIDLPGTTVLSGLGATLDRFDQKLFFSRIPIQIMVIIVTAIVLYYLVMVANTVVDRHLGEIALLRSRGANGLQVLAVYVWEAVILVTAAVIAGPLLATALVPLLGLAPAFNAATDGGTLPTRLDSSVFLYALLGGGLSFLALLIPGIKGARFSLLSAKAVVTRPGRLLFFHTYYLDIFLLALAGVLYWELTERGTLVTRSVFGEQSVDALLLAAPVIMMLSFALVFLRVIPLLLALLSALASTSSRVWLSMAFWNLARNPVPYLRPTLLLMLIAGVAMFAASYNGTLEQSYQDRGLYFAGSDARLVGLPPQLSGDKDSLTANLEDRPGVELASTAWRSNRGEVNDPSRAHDILAVDTIKFRQVSFYRDDFSETDLFTLMRKLDGGRSIVRGLDLPWGDDPSERTTALRVWARPLQSYANKSLWVTVGDGNGDSRNFRMGRLDFDGWRQLEAELVTFRGAPLPGPLTLRSIWVWELDFPEAPVSIGTVNLGFNSNGRISLSELRAVTPGEPEGTVDDLLADPFAWRPLTISAILHETLESSDAAPRDGQPALQLAWTSVPGTGLRGIFPADFEGALPVVASERFLSATGRRVGDIVDVNVAGVPVPVEIADTVNFFPTMDPARPFLLANMDTILYYANLFRAGRTVLPNEVWFALSEEEGERDAFAASINDSPFRSYLALEGDAALASLRDDPLVGTASRGIVFTVLLVLAVVTLGGYLGYFYVTSYRANLESAVLSALGLPTRALIAIHLVAHGAILLVAMTLGAFIGSRTHGVMITFLEHTERGRNVVPPFEPQTDWSGVGFIALVALVAVAAVILFVTLADLRRPLWRVLRLGE